MLVEWWWQWKGREVEAALSVVVVGALMSWQTRLCTFIITQPPALVDDALTVDIWQAFMVSCGCALPRSGFEPLLHYNFYLWCCALSHPYFWTAAESVAEKNLSITVIYYGHQRR
jgi:hypothetical protein